MKFIIACLLLSTNSYASVMHDSYREEIRDLLIKPHRAIKDWKISKYAIFQVIHIQQDELGFYVKDVYCNKIIRDGVTPHSMPENKVINVEHTWPQSKFPKRKSVTQKSDLHHLYPTDSKANSKRGNFPFTTFKNGHRISDCPDSKMGRIQAQRIKGFEPPDKQKGNVARALFYFSVRYNAPIPDFEEIVLRQWNLIDPVDRDEIERNNKIEKLQGNRNIFIDDPEMADLISDF